MQTPFRSLLSTLGFIGLLISTGVLADDSSKRLENVRSELQDLSKELDVNKSSKKQLYQQLKQQTKATSKLNKELFALDKSIKQTSQKLEKLNQIVTKQNKNQQQQLKEFEHQLRAAFTHSKPNYLQVLLNQHEPSTLARSGIYFEYFHQARKQEIDDIKASLAALSEDERQLYATQRLQKKQYEAYKAQQQKLSLKQQQRQATLSALNKKIGKQSEQITSLREEEKALQNVFKKLTIKTEKKPLTAYKSNAKFSSLKGQLPWPLIGKVSARYGSKRNLGKLTWQGIMIDAASGKEVRSVASGQVVFADWLRGFGLLIIVDHGDKYMTLYGNNQALLKEVGDKVTAGELIAQSGDKGIRQHAGLYFEIRYKGSPTNPKKWLGKQS